MRILLSAYACEPNRGSEPGNGWNWAYHLAKAGNEVHVLTRSRNMGPIEDQLVKNPQSQLYFHYVDLPPWVQKLLKGQWGMFAHYFLWQRTALPAGRKLKVQVDIVHHVTYGSLVGRSRLWKLGLPFLFGPVGGGMTAPRGFRQVFGRAWHKECIRSIIVKASAYSPGLRKMLKHTELVLASNQETVALAKKAGARRVELSFDTVLPRSFFPEKLTEPVASRKLRLLWVGRVYPRKGLPLTLLALRKSLDLGVPARLTVVGDGPLRDMISEWIRKYRLEEYVDRVGQVPWQKVREFYLSHDLFVLTTLRDSGPVQHLEAMACGLPIVTLNIHGSRDLVPDDAGIKVKVTNPEETAEGVARAIQRLYNSPETRFKMREAGYNFARTQQWEVKIQKMMSLYESVLNAR